MKDERMYRIANIPEVLAIFIDHKISTIPHVPFIYMLLFSLIAS